jgi:hypothetical protein
MENEDGLPRFARNDAFLYSSLSEYLKSMHAITAFSSMIRLQKVLNPKTQNQCIDF